MNERLEILRQSLEKVVEELKEARAMLHAASIDAAKAKRAELKAMHLFDASEKHQEHELQIAYNKASIQAFLARSSKHEAEASLARIEAKMCQVFNEFIIEKRSKTHEKTNTMVSAVHSVRMGFRLRRTRPRAKLCSAFP
jgi:hypothetical protein